MILALLAAQGDWVNKQYFVREMYLTQAGRAIHNLENRFHWNIEHSTFTDEHGFKSYRVRASFPSELRSICPQSYRYKHHLRWE